MSEKIKKALKVLLVAVLSAIVTFLSTVFFDSCKTFDFSAEKLDIQVQSEEKGNDLLNQTFDLNIEKNNGVF